MTDQVKKSFTRVRHQPDERYSEKVGYDDLQKNNEYAFGEYAERSAWFALYVLQACRHLLARAIFRSEVDKEKLKLKLFISHAKKDSLPLAHSLRSALKQKEYFSTWYDATDLDGVDDWRQAIKDGVNNSVVIVLRTEKYDTRPWCRQEFVWADQCAVPIVCVEARNSLEYAADILAAKSRTPSSSLACDSTTNRSLSRRATTSLARRRHRLMACPALRTHESAACWPKTSL